MSDATLQQTENKMGIMPVNKLLITMALPMIISMLVQALYNVVDSIFVAMINENALTAVSLAFPIQNLLIAVGSGVGVGINALLSRALGQRDQPRVNKVAMQGLLLIAICYLVFLLFSFTGVNIFMRAQTDIAQILDYGNIYLQICCAMSFGLFFQFTFERLLQSTGRTFYTMITQGIGAVINIILDPILIFGLLGMPKMGVAGAALATVLGQIAAACLALFFNYKKNHDVTLSFSCLRPDRHILFSILYIGIPSILMMAISSVMTFGLNKILIAFSSTAVAVFGVYFKLQSFVFMPIFGLNNGMVPIVAYNYGAGKEDRIHRTIRYAACYAIGIMCLGVILFQAIPGPLLHLFSASEHMMSMGIPALRIISIHFVFAGFSIIASSVCQALGMSVYSLIVSLIRQLIVLLPAAYLLSLSGNINAVWWAFPIAELVSVLLCALFLKKTLAKVKRSLHG
ncbi:MATE family efflux transporter [Ihubacter massiliensis]|uniref:Probable multidrug resistance protein NorM n=1 Tax=Hominibacterium faecale TaxID=2839743 RepID=A0A9J6QYZ9_9FIRM|nr:MULTISPECIES: MATE family efflux transporter [Eubacteriales Family XIII. Incertae Sedis]MCO7123578.1 MATE family efflux transporter [Ihubacter massiliensis]MCU7380674.1 MATE family efflux transporter [Hominibacterium faecale]